MGWKDTITESEETPKKSWKDTIIDDSEETKTGKLAAAGRGFTEGLTLGTGGEIGSGILATLDALRRGIGIETEEEKVNRQLQEQGFTGDIPTAKDKTILSQYQDFRDTSKAADVKAKEDQIEAYMGGEIVGGLAPVIGSGGASIAGKGILAAGKEAGKIGAKYGLVSGLGTSEADLTKGEVGQLAQDVALGGIAGGITGGLVGGVPAIASKGIEKARGLLRSTEDIGKRLDLQLEKGLAGQSTSGNKLRASIEDDLMTEAKFLQKNVQEDAMNEAKNKMSQAFQGEARDITPVIDNALKEVGELSKTYKTGPQAETLDTLKNLLNQEKEKLIQLPDNYTAKFPTKSQALKDANEMYERMLKGDQYKVAAKNVQTIEKLFDTAAKLKKGSKLTGLEATELNMNLPKIADDLGIAPADAIDIARDIVRLNVTVPKIKTITKKVDGKTVTEKVIVDEPKELTRVLEKYIKPTLEDTPWGKLQISRGSKVLKELEYRPDIAQPPVVKDSSDIFDLMKTLRDITMGSPDKAIRSAGKRIDDIFDQELTKGMSKEQKALFDQSREMYRTKYDIDEALGSDAFMAPKGSVAEVKGWSDIRRAMDPLEEVSVINPKKEVAEDLFGKIEKLTGQKDLLARLKEKSTMSNLAEGQSGLVPTKASYIAVGGEKLANLVGRGINYASKGNALVKMDSAALKMMAEKTRQTSPQLSNFLESLSNVENHTRRNALVFAASQKAGLKEELDKYFKDEEE